MAKFNKDNPSSCPQCGEAADYQHHRQIFQNCGGLPGLEGANNQFVPHMHRTCRVCGYEWTEEPLV